jgi:hypothetical protein
MESHFEDNITQHEYKKKHTQTFTIGELGEASVK